MFREGKILIICCRRGGRLGRRCCGCMGRGCCWLRCGSRCAGSLTLVLFCRGLLVGRRAVVVLVLLMLMLLLLLLLPQFDVLGEQPGLILALGRYLDGNLGLLGGFQVVSEVRRVVEALQRPAGILLVVVVQARSGGGSAMGMRMGMWRVGNKTVALGSTSRASAGCSHCHSSRRGLPLACFAESVGMMVFCRAN